jgi:hypothetical protein
MRRSQWLVTGSFLSLVTGCLSLDVIFVTFAAAAFD